MIKPSTPGGFKIYDNPVESITNQPKFPWHLENLQNYVGMTTEVEGEASQYTQYISAYDLEKIYSTYEIRELQRFKLAIQK